MVFCSFTQLRLLIDLAKVADRPGRLQKRILPIAQQEFISLTEKLMNKQNFWVVEISLDKETKLGYEDNADLTRWSPKQDNAILCCFHSFFCRMSPVSLERTDKLL
jgi:hypothetical protein